MQVHLLDLGIHLLVHRSEVTYRSKPSIETSLVLLVRRSTMSPKVLVLLDRSLRHLAESLNGLNKLGRVVANALLTTVFSVLILRLEEEGLLEVDEDVQRTVELGGDVVAVVVSLVNAARVALGTSVVALTHTAGGDPTVALDGGAELLNARETVVNAARGTRSDGVGHVENGVGDLGVTEASH